MQLQGYPGVWPAPASVPLSPWDAMRMVMAPRPNACVERSTARRPARLDRKQKHPQWVTGTAHVHGEPMFPYGTGNFPADSCIVIAPGAFSDSLRRIHAGIDNFELRLDHKRRHILARYSDGCIDLWMECDNLVLRIHNRGVAGRLAVWVIGCTKDRRELSIGATVRQWRKVGPSMFRVTRADLDEVSVVKDGACSGARLLL